jgi:hypothetical protein
MSKNKFCCDEQFEKNHYKRSTPMFRCLLKELQALIAFGGFDSPSLLIYLQEVCCWMALSKVHGGELYLHARDGREWLLFKVFVGFKSKKPI